MASWKLKQLRIVFLSVLFLLTSSYKRDDVDNYLLAKWRQIKKQQSSFCVEAASKCFSTGQCCRGLVCAAFDDYFGQKPEVPGLCVKEKDLQGCTSNVECEGGTKCASLGRTGEKYCLPRSMDAMEPKAQTLKEALLNKVLGGLGAECGSDNDCKAETEVDQQPLCCQDVRRGRQGVRRVCDRKTQISHCIVE